MTASDVTVAAATDESQGSSGPKPLTIPDTNNAGALLVKIFVWGPMLAFLAAIAVSIQMGLRLTELVFLNAAAFVIMYFVSGWGVTIGNHRCFTHGAFVPTRA